VSPKQRDGKGFWPFDVDRARDLLMSNGWDTGVSPAVCVDAEKAGVSEGTKLSFLLRYVEGRPALTRLMEQFTVDAAKAGIELRLSEVYGSVLVAEDCPGRPTPDNPKLWEISTWNGGWVYDYPTGEALFQSGAAFNCSNYTDAHADELIDKSATSDDLEALYEYQEYISEQVPVLFLPNTPWRLFEVASNLRGFTPINPYGLVNPENWYYVEEAS
jgi:peptide/nickel transport system substrate-binding protein